MEINYRNAKENDIEYLTESRNKELIYMNEQVLSLEANLSSPDKAARIAALRELMALYQEGTLTTPQKTDYVNNHIHTTYSFSPYSPTSAAYTAWKNGLSTAGIMDHDSIAGAEEFIEAGKIIGIATTIGFECRCRMDKTPFVGKRINNTDQDSVAYLTAHGIPHQNIERVQAWLTPYRAKRELRNRLMVDNINKIVNPVGIELDYDSDIRPISLAELGGSVTERHILFALSEKMIKHTGVANAADGSTLLELLAKLAIAPAGKTLDLLMNHTDDSFYPYYLLGVLKASMVEQFYINAVEECPEVTDFISFIRDVGGISCYAYLGDVGDSVTGDKKTQAFEDSYLDELVPWLANAGFNSITYMPTRNTHEQLARLMALCDKYGLFQISGEDINTPFQSFICKALDDPANKHLITATWALIGHERAASESLEGSMFSAKTAAELPELPDRIAHFVNLQ